MRILSGIFLLFIVLIGVTFATLNSEMVSLNYYLGEREMPLSLLLVSVFTGGCFLGVIAMGILFAKARFQLHHIRKRLKLAEKEIENLRAIPLQDRH